MASVCTDGTHVPVQLTDSTVPYLVLRNRCHTDDVVTRVGAVLLATRPQNGEKQKAMSAVRSKRNLLRWKQQTGEIRNRYNFLG